ncbi:MAG: DUF5676 family membrane protein [Gemmatimonadota bacterium]|nr:DUF5676 family membrane protein [Gemmatimonadota bacterium]
MTRAATDATVGTLHGRITAQARTIAGAPMLDIKVVTWSLGIFATVSFAFCVVYGLVTPEAFHMHRLLEVALPAFRWLSWPSFVLGAAESFLWGAYVGLVFTPIYNRVWRAARSA